MAFGAKTNWILNTGGSDTNNGGGFDTGATFATDLAATLATSSAPVITSASYNFITRDNSQYVYISGGSNWIVGMYPVASTAGNAATLNAAPGAVMLYANGQPTGVFNTVSGCATTASPTGGTWGIDYSRGTSPVISYTDMIVGATTTQFTSVLNPVGPHLIGNTISVTSGATVQRVEVISFTLSGLIATCDKSLGTAAQVGVGGLGGALLTWAKAFSLFVTSNSLFIKSGTYTITTTLLASVGGPIQVIGYGTIPGDGGTKPLLTTSTNGTGMMGSAGFTGWQITNISFSNTAATRSFCWDASGGSGANWRFSQCSFDGFTVSIRSSFADDYNGSGIIDGCEFKNQSGSTNYCIHAGGPWLIYGNYFHGSAGIAIFQDNVAQGGPLQIINNIFSSNNHDIDVSAANVTVSQIIASNSFYASVGDSIICSIANNSAVLINNVFDIVGGFAVNWSGGSVTNLLYMIQNNAFHASVSGNYSSLTRNLGDIILTASPFTNPSGGDFSLNNTAGGGALVRAAAYPSTFGTSTTNYLDVGAVQHQASGSTGATAWAY